MWLGPRHNAAQIARTQPMDAVLPSARACESFCPVSQFTTDPWSAVRYLVRVMARTLKPGAATRMQQPRGASASAPATKWGDKQDAGNTNTAYRNAH
jgi:hypothetical protein